MLKFSPPRFCNLAYLPFIAALVALGFSESARAAAGPPMITQQPASTTVLQGSGATFSVTVDGTAPFTYQWYKDTMAIIGATSSSYAITSTQPVDEGFYSVAVTNALGDATSASAELVEIGRAHV